jgi:hypothetical protein
MAIRDGRTDGQRRKRKRLYEVMRHSICCHEASLTWNRPAYMNEAWPKTSMLSWNKRDLKQACCLEVGNETLDTRYLASVVIVDPLILGRFLVDPWRRRGRKEEEGWGGGERGGRGGGVICIIITFVRYCNDPVCQAALQSQQRCEFCGETKDKRTCYRLSGKREYSPVCRECEHPKCAACGSTHEGQRGLRSDHPNILGEIFNKQWFCNAKVCKEKMRAIIQWNGPSVVDGAAFLPLYEESECNVVGKRLSYYKTATGLWFARFVIRRVWMQFRRKAFVIL